MGTETDFEARCRLAYECGSLSSQLQSAKDYIAFLENKRLPGGYRYTQTSLRGLPVHLAWESDGHLQAVFICGTLIDPSEFKDGLVSQWQELVTRDAEELRFDREAA